MKTDAKVLICYNKPVSVFSIYNGKPAGSISSSHGMKDFVSNDLSESGFSKEIGNIKKILQEYFIEVKTLPIDGNVENTINKIVNFSPDVIFNFVESIEGISTYEYCIAGLFELLRFQFTGNVPTCLGNCLDKERTKSILNSFGIASPNSFIIKNHNNISQKEFKLKFPVILKLQNEDASIGISEYSVVENFLALNKQLSFLFENYNKDIIIEEYIDGRELNVAVLGNKVLPISEIQFEGLPEGFPKIVTYDGKWIAESIYYEYTKPCCPAILNKEMKKKIEEIALSAFNAMNCRDYARVDIRLDSDGTPFVIEVNPNPDISMDSGFARAAAAAGLSYADLLFTIANFALARKEYDTQIKAS